MAWLERFLHDFEGTVVAITHDRYFLDNVAGWILEQAMARLEEIVKQLEQGDAPLEDALALFEEGTRLMKKCTTQRSSSSSSPRW